MGTVHLPFHLECQFLSNVSMYQLVPVFSLHSFAKIAIVPNNKHITLRPYSEFSK